MKWRLFLICGGLTLAGATPFALGRKSGWQGGPEISSGNVEPRPEQSPGRLESPRQGRTEAMTSCTAADGRTWFRGQAGYSTCREAAHHKAELSGRVASPADLSSTNGVPGDTGSEKSRAPAPHP